MREKIKITSFGTFDKVGEIQLGAPVVVDLGDLPKDVPFKATKKILWFTVTLKGRARIEKV